MSPGMRVHKSASLRVAIPMGLPEDMHDQVREIIDVQSRNQRKGFATKLLRNVCTEADVEALTLLVQVQGFADGMSNDQLCKWYSRFGFVKFQDEPCVLMARSPR